MSTSTDKPNIAISDVKIVNHQIIVTGKNLSNISTFKIKEGTNTISLAVESKQSTRLVANTNSNVVFSAGKIIDFIFSTAQASSVFSVNFSLCDSILGGKGFNCSITPNDKEVLSYDATSGKWKPRGINGISYKGAWDALNDPQPTTADVGDYFIVSVANPPYQTGDWIVFNGTSFDRIDNSQMITSVFGRTGAIVSTKGDYVLNKLGDVDLTTTPPVNGNTLIYNGTNWVPGVVTSGGGSVTSVSATSPISVSNGTSTPSISISQSTTSTSGYLSSTDWNTFNNKEAAITAGTTSQYYRGDKSWRSLDTNAVVESTNLYHTGARVLGTPITAPVLTNSAIATSDTVQTAFGKLQAQFNNILSVVLTGLSTATNSVVTTSDTIIGAFGKLQKQITDLTTTVTTLSASDSNKLSKNSADSITAVITVSGAGDIIVPTSPAGLTSAVNKSYVDAQVSTGTNQWVSDGAGNIYRSSGKVGIGTSSASGPLDVQGGIASSGAGLPITLIGQNGAAGGDNIGGNIILTAGNSVSTSTNKLGGSVLITGGTGAYFNSALSSRGGPVTITAGTGGTSGNGGFATLQGGNSGATAGAGGHAYVKGGSGTTGAGGSVLLSGGTSASGNGGGVNISGGNGTGGTNIGGVINLQAGQDVATTYQPINLQPNGGSVGIGTSSPSYTLHVNGSVAGTSAYNNLSDVRLKKNIGLIPNSLDKVLQLNGVFYHWRTAEYPEKKFSNRQEMGVIAQQVEKVFPEAISTDRDGVKSVAYSMLIAPIINSIKELNNKITIVSTQIYDSNERFSLISKNKASRKELELLRDSNARNRKEILALRKENEEIKARLIRLESNR
nr:hypothetical protein BHI3_12210 [Bacteriovorax sp. HI3]